MTCWRRLRDWNNAGVWTRLHENLLAELHAAGALDWSRAVIDGSHLRAMKGGPKPDRARSTVPKLARNIPPVRGRRGRPRRRPDTVYADCAYDHGKYRKQVRAVGVTPVIARRGTEHGSGLGQYRWVDVPADQKHQAVEPVAVCTSGSLTSGSKDDVEAPKATGRVGAVPRAGQG
jgi:transposase